MAGKAKKALAKVEAFSKDQVALIKRTVAVGATDDELQLFLHQAKKSGLDPLAKQIYFQKYKSKHGESKITIITGIDGYRSVAERTGSYAGCDDYLFNDVATMYDLISSGEQFPVTATATVYRLIQGNRVGFTATAEWTAYCPASGKDFMWKKMPYLMLGKCAESLALRKAFPQDLSGIYTTDEMAQAEPKDKVDVQVTEEPVEPEAPKKDLTPLKYHLGLLSKIKAVKSVDELNTLKEEVRVYVKDEAVKEERQTMVVRLCVDIKAKLQKGKKKSEEGIGDDGLVEDAEAWLADSKDFEDSPLK